MTAPEDRPEDARPEDARPEHPHELPLDEELAWQQIIANYGERARLGDPAEPAVPKAEPDGTEAPREGSAPPADDRQDDPGGAVGGSAFDTSYLDANDANDANDARFSHDVLDAGSGDQADPPRRRASDEEHFVPPDPPPVPRGTPARRLAWAGLLLPPVIMVLAVGLRWALPSLVSTGLVAAFVGGFVYLVATMPRDSGDGWGDGAVV